MGTNQSLGEPTPRALYDVVSVGGGAAGLTAGMYAARRALKTVILAKDLGGQAATTSWIENYPGVGVTDGLELMVKFRDQALQFGAEFVATEAEKITPHDNGFMVTTPQGEFTSRAVILAFGLTPRDLGVPGEEALKGRGVSYCVTCDGPLFKGKRVLVVGGGSSALDAAEFLTHLTDVVHIVYEREVFRGPKALIAKVLHDPKITKHLGEKVVEIRGRERVESVLLSGGGETVEVPVDGVFVELGHIVKTAWLKGLVDLDERGHVIVTKNCATSRPGIFAAGDVADIAYKQVVVSAGEGAKAALQAYHYLQGGDGRSIVPDWTLAKPS